MAHMWKNHNLLWLFESIRSPVGIVATFLWVIGLCTAHGQPNSAFGTMHTTQIDGVKIEYFVPNRPAVKLSADGNTMISGDPSVVVIANPVPPVNPFHILPRPKLQTLGTGTSKLATIPFTITYVTAGQTDFNNVSCVTFPDAAKAAFNEAAALWSSRLNSPVPITIKAGWASLGGSTLGYSGGSTLNRNFLGSPQSSTWYKGALANAIAGYDLTLTGYDMQITYSSDFPWYYGTDGNPSAGTYDLMSVAFHEICHGLGFSGSMSYISGTGSWGNNGEPYICDRFAQDNGGTALLNTTTYPNPSTALGSALTSGSVWFYGTAAMAANGGGRVKLYAPATWAAGSSYSHLDYNTFKATSHRLMVYAISLATATHDPGTVTMGLLRDVGWPLLACPTGIAATDGTSASYVQVTWVGVSGATHYRVAQATSPTGTRTDLGTWQTETTYDDTSATVGTTYYYFVRSATSSGGANVSGYSTGDTGWRALLSPTITTSTPLPSGTVNAAYILTLAATGGTTPYTWTNSIGRLPSGLSLNSAGVISGTPSVATNASFTVKVNGGDGNSSTQPFSLSITPPPYWMLNVTLSGGSGSVRPVVGLYTMPLGSSTNVVATADDWYRIQSLTTNGTPVTAAAEKKTFTNPIASIAANETNTVNVTFTGATPVLVGGSVSNATLLTYAKNNGYGNNESGAAADANLFYDWLLGIDPLSGPYTPGLAITAMTITNTDLTIVMQLTTNDVPKNTQINGWLQIQGSTNVGGLYTNIVSAQLPQAVFSGNGEARIDVPSWVTPHLFYKAHIHSTP